MEIAFHFLSWARGRNEFFAQNQDCNSLNTESEANDKATQRINQPINTHSNVCDYISISKPYHLTLLNYHHQKLFNKKL